MIRHCLLCLTLGLAASSLAAEQPPPAASQPTSARSSDAEGLTSWHLEVVYRRIFPDRVAILSPRFPGDSWAENATYVTYAGGRLEARDAQTGRSLWPTAIRSAAEPTLLRAYNNLHVFASKHHFFAVSTNQGRQVWQFGDPPPDDPNVDPESLLAITEIEMQGNRLFAIRDRCEVLCVDVVSGNLLWRMPIERSSAQRLLSDDKMLYVSNAKPSDETAIFAVDLRSGVLRQKLTLPHIDGDIIRPHAMLPGKDDTLLLTTPNLVAAICKHTGQLRWRIRPPKRLKLSTIMVTGDSVFYGSTTNAITRHRLQDGRRLWSTAEMGKRRNANMWMTISENDLLVATSDALASISPQDGRCRWIARNPGALDCYPPVVTPHAIFTITPMARDANDPGEANMPRTRYKIRCFDRITGADLLSPAPAITDPLESFGGLYVRGDILILLDATRAIGYVRRAEKP